MFFRKKQREIDKAILQSDKNRPSLKELSKINVKIASKEQIFSAYSYSGDKLNPEFCAYLFEQCEHVPLIENFTVCLHTDEEIGSDEVKETMKNHYRAEYKDAKKAMKRNTAISFIMTLLGIAALTLLFTLHYFSENDYLNTIMEIAAWVFIWEAVDCFFLQRPVLKARCLTIQKIYMANVEVLKNNLK